MQILLAADHAGFVLKEKLIPALVKLGYEVSDFTPKFKTGDDYPMVANELTQAIIQSSKSKVKSQKQENLRGILICGSGIGMCIAANRQAGIRAMVGHNLAEVKLAREHNDINILCLSGQTTSLSTAHKLIEVFLKTKASSITRHTRRIKQLN